MVQSPAWNLIVVGWALTHLMVRHIMRWLFHPSQHRYPACADKANDEDGCQEEEDDIEDTGIVPRQCIPSILPISPFSACSFALCTSFGVKVRRNSTAMKITIKRPPTYSATVNCHPIRTIKIIPSSITRLVEAVQTPSTKQNWPPSGKWSAPGPRPHKNRNWRQSQRAWQR